jgi:hypothetical protein
MAMSAGDSPAVDMCAAGYWPASDPRCGGRPPPTGPVMGAPPPPGINSLSYENKMLIVLNNIELNSSTDFSRIIQTYSSYTQNLRTDILNLWIETKNNLRVAAIIYPLINYQITTGRNKHIPLIIGNYPRLQFSLPSSTQFEVKSIQINEGYKAILFKQADFVGEYLILENNTPNLYNIVRNYVSSVDVVDPNSLNFNAKSIIIINSNDDINTVLENNTPAGRVALASRNWNSQPQIDARASVAWNTPVALASRNWNSTDAVASRNWNTPASRTARASSDWNSQPQIDARASLAWNGSVAQRARASSEWNGSDARASRDWNGSVAQRARASSEWNGSDARASRDWNGSVAQRARASVEWNGSDARASRDWNGSVAQRARASVEWNGSDAQNARASLEWNTPNSVLARASAEWNGSDARASRDWNNIDSVLARASADWNTPDAILSRVEEQPPQVEQQPPIQDDRNSRFYSDQNINQNALSYLNSVNGIEIQQEQNIVSEQNNIETPYNNPDDYIYELADDTTNYNDAINDLTNLDQYNMDFQSQNEEQQAPPEQEQQQPNDYYQPPEEEQQQPNDYYQPPEEQQQESNDYYQPEEEQEQQQEESQINTFSIFQRLAPRQILPINGLSYNQINTIGNKLNLLIM